MKRNILFLLCGLLISFGCGGGGTTNTDAGAPDVQDDNAGTDQTNTDTAEEVVEDAGGTDEGTDEGGTDTNVPPVGPDGKVGSPCSVEADCFQEAGLGPDDDPTSICFMGFCTRFCREVDDQGEVVPVEGACSDVSAASYLGDEWQCPADFGICLPGPVSGVSVGCTKDDECDDIGTNSVCAGVVWDGSTGVDGVCMPAMDRQDHSTECSDDTDCQSLFCIGNDPTTGALGVCVAHCATGSDCPGGEGHLCQAFGFLLPGEDGESSEEPGAWAGLCFPSTGSLDNCKYSECSEGESCIVTTQPSTLIGQYNCVTGIDGGLAGGEICSADNDCFSGNCMFDGLGVEEVSGYCTNVCPLSVDQCGDGMVCTDRVLNDKGTPDKDWDDPLYSLCVFDSENSPCLVDDSWCADELDCTAVDGWPEEVEGLGLCVPGVPPCETYCGLVEANCTGDNAITFATDCATDCATWPEGPEGATSGNSVQCRIYHLGVAADDPATHCPHGNPEGGNFDVGFPCTDPEPADPCDPNPCLNGGLCANVDDAASCDCTGSGFEGATCETDIDECAAAIDNCDVNATCTNDDGGFSCACNEGFNGDGVSCSADPLEDGAACADASNCSSGFCVDGFCCDNACEADCASCSGAESGGTNGSCTLLPAGAPSSCDPYLCNGSSFDCPASCVDDAECAGGTFCIGNICDIDEDECTLNTDNCDANATCTNTVGGFSCACNSGYSGDGITCTDDDECTAGTDNCHDNASCTNTVGGFSCACNSGYSGDGITCTDHDECTAGTDNCDSNATCTNTVGGFSCACDSGYSGDGTTCVDDDECALDLDNCDVNATCTNTGGSFSCACDAGYDGDGVSCSDIDECTTGTHSCTALEDCTNTVGGHTCSPAVIGYASHAQAVLQSNCGGCHTGSPGNGGHNLTADYSDADNAASHASCTGLTVGECALLRAGNGSMPPGAGTVSAEDLAILQAWVDGGMLP